MVLDPPSFPLTTTDSRLSLLFTAAFIAAPLLTEKVLLADLWRRRRRSGWPLRSVFDAREVTVRICDLASYVLSILFLAVLPMPPGSAFVDLACGLWIAYFADLLALYVCSLAGTALFCLLFGVKRPTLAAALLVQVMPVVFSGVFVLEAASVTVGLAPPGLGEGTLAAIALRWAFGATGAGAFVGLGCSLLVAAALRCLQFRKVVLPVASLPAPSDELPTRM